MVEQNVHSALKKAERAIVLEMGRLVLHRPASELLADPNIERLFLGRARQAGGGLRRRRQKTKMRARSRSRR